MRAAALVLLAVMASGCAMHGAPSLGPAAAPDAQERALLARVPAHDDPALAALLAKVTSALRSHSEPAATAPEIIVVRDPAIAAFVLPSRRIYLHTGLLARLENEAQLATILARALTHASRPAALERRAADGRVDGALLAIPAVIGAALATAETDGRMLSPVAEAILGGNLTVVHVAAVTGYGDALEAQADVGALRRLVRAGYDPKHAATTFERLRRDAKAGGPLERFFLGNDAALAARAAALARLVTQDYAVAAAAPGTITTTPEFDESIASLARDNARLELHAGRFRAAQEQLDRALTARPADAQTYLTRGDLLRLRAQRARGAADRDELARRALAAYERSASLDPGLVEVVRQLGLLYYQQGQRERAREAFARYIALSPDAPDAPRVREYLAALDR